MTDIRDKDIMLLLTHAAAQVTWLITPVTGELDAAQDTRVQHHQGGAHPHQGEAGVGGHLGHFHFITAAILVLF